MEGVMKIAIVGLDDKFVIDFANQLAKLLNLKHQNFAIEFNRVLLNFINVSSSDFLQAQESALMQRLINEENKILSLSGDEYLSNKNYLFFKNTTTIFMERKEKNKILNNIQKLIKKHCEITIKQNKFKTNEIANKIRGKYNG